MNIRKWNHSQIMHQTIKMLMNSNIKIFSIRESNSYLHIWTMIESIQKFRILGQ